MTESEEVKEVKASEKVTWGDVRAGDVFLYTFEERAKFVGICENVVDGDVVVSDIYAVTPDALNEMDRTFIVSSTGVNKWEFRINQILFHHTTPLEELRDKFPELMI